MKCIKKIIHKDIKNINGVKLEQRVARGIILDECKILLLYTKEYNDYCLPGGGVDPSENLIEGLYRRLSEKVGAKNLKVLGDLGYIAEYRPTYNAEYDLIHIVSYFYICKAYIDSKNLKPDIYNLGINTVPVWIDIHEAIAHNKRVMEKDEPSMGFSIKRETIALELVAEKILKGQVAM